MSDRDSRRIDNYRVPTIEERTSANIEELWDDISKIKNSGYLTEEQADLLYNPLLTYTPENILNKITTILSTSTDVEYPSAKATYNSLLSKLDVSLKGVANGIAELDELGFVKNTQLPSYVDDVIEGVLTSSTTFVDDKGTTIVPASNKIYIDIVTEKTYRWSGTQYSVISDTVALGETSETAYRGDRGKIAYDHSQLTHDKSFIGLNNVDNTSDLSKPISTLMQEALDLKVDKINGYSLALDTDIIKWNNLYSSLPFTVTGDPITGTVTFDRNVHVTGNITASEDIVAYMANAVTSDVLTNLNTSYPLYKPNSNTVGLKYNGSQFEVNVSSELQIRSGILIPASHSHTISDVTGLQSDLDLKVTAVSGYSLVLNTEIAKIHSHANKSDLDGITSTLIGNWNAAYTKTIPFTVTSDLVTIDRNLHIVGNITASEDIIAYMASAVTSDVLTNLNAQAPLYKPNTSTLGLKYNTSQLEVNASSELQIKSGVLTPAIHTHTISDIVGLQSSLDLKVTVASGYSLVADTEIAKIHSHSNKSDLDGITATLIANWTSAYTDKHTHSNKSDIDGITATLIANWNSAYTNNHTHSNKATLDGITATLINQWNAAYTDRHTHTNKSDLDGITTALITQWSTAYTKTVPFTVASDLVTIDRNLHVTGSITASNDVIAYVASSVTSDVLTNLNVSAPLYKINNNSIGFKYNTSQLELNTSNELQIKSGVLTPAIHTHTITDVIGLQSVLNNKLDYRTFGTAANSAITDFVPADGTLVRSTSTFSADKLTKTVNGGRNIVETGITVDGSNNVGGVAGITSLIPASLGGQVGWKFLNYSIYPYGFIYRIYDNGSCSIQAQRESDNSEVFNLHLQPLGGNVDIGYVGARSEKFAVNGSGFFNGNLTAPSATLTTGAFAGSILSGDASGNISHKTLAQVGAVSTQYNRSLNTDSRNSYGVTRLYRNNDDSDYSVQTNWTGTHWHLKGYAGDSFHAECRVGYADSAGNAGNADTLDGQHGSYYNHRNYTDAANYLGGYYISGGTEKPNHAAFGSGKLKLAMLSGSNLGFGGGWNDVLWLSAYSGGDVKNSHALVFDKYSSNVYVSDQDFDSGSWGTGYKLWHSGNFDPSTKAEGRIRTNWNDGTVLYNVVGHLAWRNYGNNHTIFDASSGLAPNGTAIDRINTRHEWIESYPILMGWNGNDTYGVKVDRARVADIADRANGNFYIDDNYGNSIVGAYRPDRYQGIFAMGDAYKLPADGTSSGNLYGLAWTHSNVGGQSVAGLGHQLLIMANGTTRTAIGIGIWTVGSIATNNAYELKDASGNLIWSAALSGTDLVFKNSSNVKKFKIDQNGNLTTIGEITAYGTIN